MTPSGITQPLVRPSFPSGSPGGRNSSRKGFGLGTELFGHATLALVSDAHLCEALQSHRLVAVLELYSDPSVLCLVWPGTPFQGLSLSSTDFPISALLTPLPIPFPPAWQIFVYFGWANLLPAFNTPPPVF